MEVLNAGEPLNVLNVGEPVALLGLALSVIAQFVQRESVISYVKVLFFVLFGFFPLVGARPTLQMITHSWITLSSQTCLWLS